MRKQALLKTLQRHCSSKRRFTWTSAMNSVLLLLYSGSTTASFSSMMYIVKYITRIISLKMKTDGVKTSNQGSLVWEEVISKAEIQNYLVSSKRLLVFQELICFAEILPGISVQVNPWKLWGVSKSKDIKWTQCIHPVYYQSYI